MMVLIISLVIGVAVGAAVTSFRSGAGNELSFPLGIIAGIVGSVVGTFVFARVSPMIFGEGPEFIVSMLGAAVLAVAAVLVAHAVKK